ncbi:MULTISPECIES: hypothetical protein [unclassified Enterococcus]|uniref:hypothetical protein n=1 Tax=unclassified Enterococcus TaxID=2608891 RepID=UPI001908C36D|nr:MULTISPECIES: hypothetical protein [unclassified Enterococcus]MBK0038574.1 hypothetical protein [Enterococcus sp. S52]MBK0071216.1 hypothetical protein [Enterococcus sp. S53]MBK0141845.1 hypothetical protein [Enterococcus sp. S76]MBK0145377.1 hypothetical protein [Enterococcus sp. S77]
MPDTTDLRKKILDFKEREKLSYQTMANLIQENKSEVYQAVVGARTNPKSNIIISKLLQAYGL